LANILKASTVDAIYDKDPKKHPDAKKLKQITYQYALENGLRVMDSTAFALCQDCNMPIIVFNCNDPDNIEKIIKGETLGTLITK
jgi:uridylate kinase